LVEAIKPDWNKKISSPVVAKAGILSQEIGDLSSLVLENLFPCAGELSGAIDKDHFILSHLQQPDLFIRIRPGCKNGVIEKLQQHASGYEFIPPFTIRLPNGFKVDEIFGIDKEVVIQDLNSQRVGLFLLPLNNYFSAPISVWDCCAASGGKSIMAKDMLNDIELSVSDVREPILVNLKNRFAAAGLSHYKSFIADLSITGHSTPNAIQLSNYGTASTTTYDLILADLPCTGSGTWGRTPEQLYFFNQSSIERYNQLQKKICANIIPHLKKSGKLVYITCSVFKKENEDIVQFIQNEFPLKLERSELLKGYNDKADTMYAALLSYL
jgi:16S rRNA (cytosine967-C5)-methyltransferase